MVKKRIQALEAMQLYAWAPGKCPAPDLYCRYTWVKEIGVNWDDIGGITVDEVNLLAEMLSLKGEADSIKARVEAKARRG